MNNNPLEGEEMRYLMMMAVTALLCGIGCAHAPQTYAPAPAAPGEVNAHFFVDGQSYNVHRVAGGLMACPLRQECLKDERVDDERRADYSSCAPVLVDSKDNWHVAAGKGEAIPWGRWRGPGHETDIKYILYKTVQGLQFACPLEVRTPRTQCRRVVDVDGDILGLCFYEDPLPEEAVGVPAAPKRGQCAGLRGDAFVRCMWGGGGR